ncbi:MAG: hypothetical protein IPL79_03520 [Myxococcales bacterium]|nr:hypothetical protein [Myxococcales bacterium]
MARSEIVWIISVGISAAAACKAPVEKPPAVEASAPVAVAPAPQPTAQPSAQVLAPAEPARSVTPRAASGTVAKFSKQVGDCELRGTYDAGRYTEAELLATAELLDGSFGGFYVNSSGIPDPAMAAKQAADLAHLNGLLIVAEPAWEQRRADVITWVKRHQQLEQSVVTAHQNPAQLAASPFYGACRDLADGLMSKTPDGVVAAWRVLATAEAARPGAAPSWAEKLASGVDAEAARADLAGYGWNNCANLQIQELPDATEKFFDLFITHKYDCSANE